MNKTIVLASYNPGKLRELSHLLATCQLEIVPQSQFQVPEVAETGLSFVENAIIKARHAAQYTGLPAIADDSGIEVDALAGQPGIYSARFAGEKATDEANNQLLLEKLIAVRDHERTARYHCAIVYMRHANDPVPLICQGNWKGSILREPRGEHGFGYDPLFYVPTHHCSSAQLPPDIKNKISHRGQALRALQYLMMSTISSARSKA